MCALVCVCVRFLEDGPAAQIAQFRKDMEDPILRKHVRPKVIIYFGLTLQEKLKVINEMQKRASDSTEFTPFETIAQARLFYRHWNVPLTYPTGGSFTLAKKRFPDRDGENLEVKSVLWFGFGATHKIYSLGLFFGFGV